MYVSLATGRRRELENENTFCLDHVFGDIRRTSLIATRVCAAKNDKGMPTGMAR
jgi:hypothetical protein